MPVATAPPDTHTDAALLEMAAVLRRHGARVRLPLDLMEARPWGAAPHIRDGRRLERQWLGTTVHAASVEPVRRARVRKGCCCECREVLECCACEGGWAWKVHGYRDRVWKGSSGVRDTQEKAQNDADDKLLEMMTEARRQRLAAVNADPYAPRDTLSVRKT
jgi:hypothetical protein